MRSASLILITAGVMLDSGPLNAQSAHPALAKIEAEVAEYRSIYQAKRSALQYRYRFMDDLRICETGTGKTIKTYTNGETVEFKQGKSGFVLIRNNQMPYRPSEFFGPQSLDYSYVYGINSKYSFELKTNRGGKDYFLSTATRFEDDPSKKRCTKSMML